MNTETLTAQKLLDEFVAYPKFVELYVGDDEWREITHISDWQNVNGVLDSDDHIHIECGDYQYRHQRMDELTIRYDGDKSILIEMTLAEERQLFGLGRHPYDEDFDDDEYYPFEFGECPDCGNDLISSVTQKNGNAVYTDICPICGYVDEEIVIIDDEDAPVNPNIIDCLPNPYPAPLVRNDGE